MELEEVEGRAGWRLLLTADEEVVVHDVVGRVPLHRNPQLIFAHHIRRLQLARQAKRKAAGPLISCLMLKIIFYIRDKVWVDRVSELGI